MPEIAEVARIVHHLTSAGLVGTRITRATALDDANVFGKAGTTAKAVEMALTTRRPAAPDGAGRMKEATGASKGAVEGVEGEGVEVVGIGRQGKYFWLQMASPPHPLFHFGMTGWMHIRGQHTYYYRKTEHEEADEADTKPDWPPRFWKFAFETDATPPLHVAFTDARRFARVRLLDCPGDQIRQTSPLKENGPDPVVDRELVTTEWLAQLMRRRHVPIKALLLDQGAISGIGNWVGDEILYHARLHPEQYSDTFSDAQIAQLHASLMYICTTAVDLLADSERFPQDWLFKHRWGKGKKDAPKQLPNGERITFLTVGGRTSCIVPSLQRKTGAVAKEVDDVVIKEKVKEEEGSQREKKKRITDAENDGVANDRSHAGTRSKRRGTKADTDSVPSKRAKVDKDTSDRASGARKQPTKRTKPQTKSESDGTPPASETPARRRSGRHKA